MTRSIFLFLCSFLLLLPALSLAGQLSLSGQLILCAPFLLFLGIPHGAIDNVLFVQEKQSGQKLFIAIYLIAVLANVGLWLVAPKAAYILFLLISMYHFGQSQFSHYFTKEHWLAWLVYFFWGLTILSGMLYFNFNAIENIAEIVKGLHFISDLHPLGLLASVFWFSLLSTLTGMIRLFFKKNYSFQVLLMEILVLGLILVSFKVFPLLIGFTLYFITLHSYKVLREEYYFLKEKGIASSFIHFSKLIAPFSILSIFGILLLFGLIHLDLVKVSYGFGLAIAFSSITLPHVFVMDRFYQLLYKNGKANSRL